MTNLHCLHGFIVAFLLIKCCYGFYLPGLAPVNYCPKNVGDPNTCPSDILVFVNRLNSAESVIPYEYDHFDFCPPKREKKSPTENLRQVVFGERIQPSAYTFTFAESVYGNACDKTYEKGPESKKKIDALIQAIRLNYQHHWIIDNMPVTSCYIIEDQGVQNKSICYPSFPVGCYVGKDLKGKDDCHSLLPKESLKEDTAYLFNHVEFTIEFRRNEKDGTNDGSGRLVKAKVFRLASIAFKDSSNIGETVKLNKPLALPKDISDKLFISYTYKVSFKENADVKWSSRWDYVLDSNHNAAVAWFSIMNSMIVVLFLSGLMAMILRKTVYRDSVWFNKSDNKADAVKRIFCSWNNNSNELRWMLVQNDVFRPPCGGLLLSVFLGSGVQIICMTMITLVLASLGLLSPANRGALMTCVLVSFVCLGTPAGYVSSTIYKSVG